MPSVEIKTIVCPADGFPELIVTVAVAAAALAVKLVFVVSDASPPDIVKFADPETSWDDVLNAI